MGLSEPAEWAQVWGVSRGRVSRLNPRGPRPIWHPPHLGSYPAYITHVIIFGQLRILNFILFLLYFFCLASNKDKENKKEKL